MYVSVWDSETGAPVAGPWENDEIPQEMRADLTWPASRTDGSASPALVRELFGSSSPRRSKQDFLLPCAPLAVGDVVVFGGDSGLVAIRPADGVDVSGFGARQQPLSWDYADAGASSPIDAPAPGHEDVSTLFGEDVLHPVEAEDFPSRLTHAAARERLLEFGLPRMTEGAMGLFPYGNRVPTKPGEDHLAALPAAHSLEDFLTMVALWVTGLRTRSLLPPASSEREPVAYWVLGALAEVGQAGSEQPAWSYVLHHT